MLQFDFGQPVRVTSLAIRGGGALVATYVKLFHIYFAHDGISWIPYKAKDGTIKVCEQIKTCMSETM